MNYACIKFIVLYDWNFLTEVPMVKNEIPLLGERFIKGEFIFIYSMSYYYILY